MASTTSLDVATPVSAAAAATTTAYEDLPHDDLIGTFNGVIWLMTGLSALFLALRTYTKISRQRGLWWDDYVLIAAWVTLLLSTIFGTISTTMGFGKHTWDIDTEGPGFPKLMFIGTMTGFWSIWAAAWSKTSFAITLLRLVTSSKIKWFIWFWILTVNIGLTAAAIMMWTHCDPPEKVWNQKMEGTCLDGNIIITYNSFISVWSGIADIVLAIIPWWVISRHSMNYKEQIGLLVCMSLGVFAGCTSIAKIITMRAITSDDMINTVPLNILGMAEAAVTIIAASIPVLRALITSHIATKARSQGGYLHSSGTKTNVSKAAREYEVLDKDSDKIKLTRLVQVTSEVKDPDDVTPRGGTPNNDQPWRY